MNMWTTRSGSLARSTQHPSRVEALLRRRARLVSKLVALAIVLVASAARADGTLVSGAPITISDGVAGHWQYFSMAVPEGQTRLDISISGGSGDADLYVQTPGQPTLGSYLCRPYLNGNAEACQIQTPVAGTYWVGVRVYAPYAGVSLRGTYEQDLTNGVAVTGLGDSVVGRMSYFKLVVPSARQHLSVKISGGTGDADLYVAQPGKPTSTSYECRPWLFGNTETCELTPPPAGATYYVGVRAYSAYAGLTLTATAYDDLFADGSVIIAEPVVGTMRYWRFDVPPDQTHATFTLSGGTGNADLYGRLGAPPTTATSECAAPPAGNQETCVVTPPPAGGTYWVGVRAGQAYEGVSLTGRYDDDGELTKGVAITPLSGGTAGGERYFRLDVPAGTGWIKVETWGGWGGSGGVALRVEQTSKGGTVVCDRSGPGNRHVCAVPRTSPGAGTYWVALRSEDSYLGVTLKATYGQQSEILTAPDWLTLAEAAGACVANIGLGDSILLPQGAQDDFSVIDVTGCPAGVNLDGKNQSIHGNIRFRGKLDFSNAKVEGEVDAEVTSSIDWTDIQVRGQRELELIVNPQTGNLSIRVARCIRIHPLSVLYYNQASFSLRNVALSDCSYGLEVEDMAGGLIENVVAHDNHVGGIRIARSGTDYPIMVSATKLTRNDRVGLFVDESRVQTWTRVGTATVRTALEDNPDFVSWMAESTATCSGWAASNQVGLLITETGLEGPPALFDLMTGAPIVGTGDALAFKDSEVELNNVRTDTSKGVGLVAQDSEIQAAGWCQEGASLGGSYVWGGSLTIGDSVWTLGQDQSIVDGNVGVGVRLVGSSGVLKNLTVVGTTAPAIGDGGDGIMVQDLPSGIGSTVHLDGVTTNSNARAGILYVGSAGTIANTTTRLNRFGLVTQPGTTPGTTGLMPVIGTGNLIEQNSEYDRLLGGDLAIPDLLSPTP